MKNQDALILNRRQVIIPHKAMLICFGENIRSLRIANGITQEQFGYELGVSAQAVSRIGYADLILNGDPENYLKTVTEYKPLD